jgi:nicotinic acid phosphoribosyltransferase
MSDADGGGGGVAAAAGQAAAAAGQAAAAAAEGGGEAAPIAAAGGGDLLAHFMARATELSDDKKYNNKSFMDYVNDPNIAAIIAKFSYPEGGDTSTVVDKEGLINAFFANDLYKLSMGPVVNQVSKHQQGCIVQFRIDLRTDSTFNEKLKEEYVLNQGSTFVDDLTEQLDTLKNRTFDATMFDKLTSGPGPIWKEYWQSNKAHPIKDEHIIEKERQKIIADYQKDDGSPIDETDFHKHKDSVILKCIPVPKDPTKPSTVVLSVVPGGGGKPDIRATGYWPLCSWLETPLMQTTYEVMHRHFLKENNKPYGEWMAESLYRTFSGMEFLSRTRKHIKVALFSGRRTGGALFNLLQIYLWDQFDSQFYPETHPKKNPCGRNNGTSSFWALETLNAMGLQCSIQPSGTHAHELSMTLNVLYPELDVTEVGFVGSQILGHLLYKRLSAGPTPTPMLTDTVGTRNFLVTAVALKDGDKPALCSFASARQDSGKLDDYAKMMSYFVTLAECATQPLLMASEIDDRDTDFYKAIEAGYDLAGVGGALGDSEKIEAKKILGTEFDKNDPTHFAASEAAKIARVWSGTDKNTGYTLKTGDGTGKVTIDDKAADAVGELVKRARNFQDLHEKAVKDLPSGKLDPLNLTPEQIKEKQDLLDVLLGQIAGEGAGHVAEEEESFTLGESTVTAGGGRRTRRKVRKVTKKYVRKNIRKSKHMRNRRSNRRNSRK